MKNLFLLVLILLIHNVSRAQVPSYVDTNELLAWYSFSGNANNNYGSTSLNGIVAGPVLTADRFGNTNSAYHFNGQRDYILIDSNFFNVALSNYTVSFWMYNDSIDNPYNYNNDQAAFNTAPHSGLELTYNWGFDGRYQILAGSVPSSYSWDILGEYESYSKDSVTSHEWNFFVIEKEQDTIYHLYINGLLDTTISNGVFASSTTTGMILGNIDSTVGFEGLMGDLDDFGIWTRALSTCEIRKLYQGHANIISQPIDTTASLGSTRHFTVGDTTIGNTFQWQVDTGFGYRDLVNGGVYSGVTTNTLTITGVTAAQINAMYRCVVADSSAGICGDTSVSARLLWPSAVNIITSNSVFSISPNPATTVINIAGPYAPDVVIYNIAGQTVYSDRDASVLYIDNLPAGVYILKLFSKDGALLYYSKLIKK